MSSLAGVAGVLALAAVWAARRALRQCRAARGADWGARWLNCLDGLNRIFCRRFHRLACNRLHLPPTGGVLVVSNHVSGLDPLLLAAVSSRPLRFLIAREEYERWWLRWLFRAIGCIPVERVRNPRAALHAARQALLAGEVVALFPHGRIHLDHEPPLPLKRGVVLLARMTGAPIYPVRIDGVRAQGHTVPAIWRRSQARLRAYPRLDCGERDTEACLETLWDLLSNGPRARRPRPNPHRGRDSGVRDDRRPG